MNQSRRAIEQQSNRATVFSAEIFNYCATALLGY